jgi:RNA polymerase primary sigma factor
MAKHQLDRNKRLLEQYHQSKSPEILRQLVLENQLLAWKVAQKHMRHAAPGLTLSDLFHEAITGLMEALVRYDYSKGFALSTYAIFWIERNVRRAKDEKGEMIRYPENFSRMLFKIKRAETEYRAESTDANNIREYVLMQTGLSEKQYEDIMLSDYICSQVSSMQEIRNNEDDQREIGEDITYSENATGMTFHKEYRDAADLCCDYDRKQILYKAMSELVSEERQIIELYFGLNDDNQPCTVVEISCRMNISKSYATKMIRRSLLKLQGILKQWNISFEDVA